MVASTAESSETTTSAWLHRHLMSAPFRTRGTAIHAPKFRCDMQIARDVRLVLVLSTTFSVVPRQQPVFSCHQKSMSAGKEKKGFALKIRLGYLVMPSENKKKKCKSKMQMHDRLATSLKWATR